MDINFLSIFIGIIIGVVSVSLSKRLDGLIKKQNEKNRIRIIIKNIDFDRLRNSSFNKEYIETHMLINKNHLNTAYELLKKKGKNEMNDFIIKGILMLERK